MKKHGQIIQLKHLTAICLFLHVRFDLFLRSARAIFARLKKIWRVWARARAIARHSRPGMSW